LIIQTKQAMKCSQLLKLIKQAGWYEDRQNGSHIILKHPEKTNMIIFPNHGSKEIGKGIAESLKKQAGIK
jgi:predicted RNA binding protein YcfA (HicA-like mRNA interferase family)